MLKVRRKIRPGHFPLQEKIVKYRTKWKKDAEKMADSRIPSRALKYNPGGKR